MMQNSLSTSNFSKYVKRIVAIAILCVTLFVLASSYYHLVDSPHDAFYEYKRYIDENTVDVLFVGSSHVYCGINPVQLWDGYGVAAFDLACGSQSPVMTFYYLKEALKTQMPKVVVLDVYMAICGDDYYYDSRKAIQVLPMPISQIKYEATKAMELETPFDNFWKFPVTHTRYNELVREDFIEDKRQVNTYLGYQYRRDLYPYDVSKLVDVSKVTEKVAPTETTEEYFRKCIELCQEKGIEVILTNTPWPDVTEETQKIFNYMGIIAKEYGIEFVDGYLHTQEIGLDYSKEIMDAGGHLNYWGVTKYTNWFMENCLKEYDLPDRREQEGYEYWKWVSEDFAYALEHKQLSVSNLSGVMEILKQDNNYYWVIMYNGKEELLTAEDKEYLIANGFDLERPATAVYRGDTRITTLYDISDYAKYLNHTLIQVEKTDAKQSFLVNGTEMGALGSTEGLPLRIYAYNMQLYDMAVYWKYPVQ